MMARLERIQRISAVFRYLLIVAAIVLGSAIIIAMLIPGQDWVSVGDGPFGELWHSGTGSRTTLIAIVAPVAIMLVLGVYWLQRLFGEYQAGHFFTDSSMRCYIWLVWLKAANFLYGAIWPFLLEKLSTHPGSVDPSISINAGSFVELIVLIVIVHLLKEAQQLSDENKAFI